MIRSAKGYRTMSRQQNTVHIHQAQGTTWVISVLNNRAHQTQQLFFSRNK